MVRIRKFKLEEFEKYCVLKIEQIKYLREISGDKVPLSKIRIKKEFKKIIDNPEDYLYAILVNEEIIGYLGCSIWKNLPIQTSYIKDVIIMKKFRGNGYGKKSIKWFINYSKKQNIERIGLGTRWENKKAQKLYESLGFDKIGINYGMKLK